MNSNSKSVDVVNAKLFKFKRTFIKVMILMIMIVLSAVACILYVLGLHIKNSILENFAAGAFTALLVTIIDYCIRWNEKKAVDARIEQLENDNQKFQTHLEDLEIELSKNISSLSHTVEDINGKKCSFCSNYVKSIQPNRSKSELGRFFFNANHRIFLLATNLHSFIAYTDILQEKAKNGVDVKVIALHPELAKRFNESRVIRDKPPEKIWKEMCDSAGLYIASAKTDDDESDLFQIKLTNKVIPTFIMILVDNQCYVANLMNGKPSKESVHILYKAKDETDTNSPVYDYANHFLSIWEHEETKHYSEADIKKYCWNDIENKGDNA